MGRCGKPFCTCCETAYADGFCDGFKNGFSTGYTRGHRTGYVSGYLDGYTGAPPLPKYEPIIRPLLAEPMVPRLVCGCYGTCTCYKPLPTFEYKPLPEPLQFVCGCYGKCKCYKPLPQFEFKPPKPILKDALAGWLLCGCYLVCNCRAKPIW